MDNLENGKTYNIEYTPICLKDYKYKGILIDHDDTWVYLNCFGVGNKSFRKQQINLTSST